MVGYIGSLRWLLLVAAAAWAISGCDWVPRSKTVTSGAYEGLQIGASKEEVVNWLQARGNSMGIRVDLVSPPRLTHKEELESLASSRAIHVSGPVFAVIVDFDGDSVSVSHSSPTIRPRFGAHFAVGSSREDVLAGIGKLMDEFQDVVAREVIPSTIKTSVSVRERREILDERLAEYDLWEIGYVRKERFSVNVLFYFADNRLVKVEHLEYLGY